MKVKKFILAAIAILIISPGLFYACADAPQKESPMVNLPQIPSIDMLAPSKTLTATFALG